MAEGITTRHQKETQQLQKDVEKLDAKLDQMAELLRSEIRAMGANLRKLFEQLMGKVGVPSNDLKTRVSSCTRSTALKMKAVTTPRPMNKQVTQSVIEHIDLTVGSRVQTKYSKLECPKFDEENFKGWRMKIEQFFEADQTRDQDKVRTVLMHLESKALQ